MDFHEGLAAVEIGATCIGDSLVRSGKYGFVDRTGRIVISPQFDYAGQFSGGLAAVRTEGTRDDSVWYVKGGKWGFINRHGVFVIPPRFDGANEFSCGRAAVELDGRWGYIGTAGDFVVPPRFHGALSFCGGLAAVVPVDSIAKSDSAIQFDIFCLQIDAEWKNEHAVPATGPWGYVDTAGRFVWKSAGWPADKMPSDGRADPKR
jgi:hypothetical protein